MIYGLFALSFNLLFGYTGLLSFGQAGFFAVGAYTASLILLKLPSTAYVMYLALLAAIFLSCTVSLIVGSICVHLSGWVFAMLTLAFGQVIHTIVYKWSFTGGDTGLTGILLTTLSLFGFSVDLRVLSNYYYFVLVIMVLCIFVLRRIVGSPFGHAIKSIRENPTRAQFIGLNLRRYRLASFVIAGTLTGLAGALFAPLRVLQARNWQVGLLLVTR